MLKVETPSSVAVSILPQGRKPRGLTNITISDADARSIPPPGLELLEKVNSAKATGEVPILYNSSVIRCVDGKWMAPQMCERCVHIYVIKASSDFSQLSRNANHCKKTQQMAKV
jgi:hypothetical protein